MNRGFLKVVCVTSVLALIVAMGTPQIGKRKEGGSTGGGSSSGGGGGRPTTNGGGSGGGSTGSGGSGGGPGRRNEPPPVRHENNGGGSQGGGGGTSQGGGLGRREDRGGGSGGGVISGGGEGGVIQGRRDGGGRVISGDNSGLGRRKTDSRSGTVRYGTTNNEAGRVTINGLRIDRPAQIINPGMNRRVLDQERVGLVVNGWRNGYYHYNRNCQDDWFYYPYYVFNPWQSDRYVCSPWYYYPSLPPYLAPTRIVVINFGWPSYNWTGSPYRYDRRDDNYYYNDRYDRNSRQELDYALDDIVDSWERQDYRAIGRLAPRNGQVHMYFDGRYSYSLGVEDFYDLFVDGIENVRTDRYEIVEVQRGRNGTARVLGKHEYSDPWGRRSQTYHQYFLEPEGRNYVIREFGTSTYRGW